MKLKTSKQYYVTLKEKVNNEYYHEESREVTSETKKILKPYGEIEEQQLFLSKGTIYCSKPYKEIVAELIKEKYSIEDEIAIVRQKENKPLEFYEYNEFVERCKTVAKDFIKERLEVLGK